MLIGAAILQVLTRNAWLTLVGALLGWLYGQSRIRNAILRDSNDIRWLRKQALSGFRWSAVSGTLLTLMWSWVLTSPPETWNDQGGMLLTFGVYPLTLMLWILGGPVAFVRGWNNRWRVLPPGTESWVLAGFLLSGLVSLAPFIVFTVSR